MENLNISDAPPQGPQPVLGGRAPPPQQTPQLPPQMFTTAAQLLDMTDTNLVLQDTVERVYAHPDPEANPPREGGLFADIKRGIFLVRGENVLLLGEIDLDKDDDPPVGYEPGELKLVQGLANERKEKEKARDKGRIKKLSTLGFEGENMGEILL
ncbi:LSM domain-containing protein [Colletotrichum cuscutae]|uniref:LSM domain-containing protein n=1 Tax=Colletotrichum cuscutae TaxID=1209917 RepID=A0AAI9VDW0_9PEZI|nr:LSM domain-containing protein [Colletotrichum cuscutae]